MPAGVARSTGNADPQDGSIALQGFLERKKLGAAGRIGEIANLRSEPGVGMVVAEPPHGIAVAQPRERSRRLDARDPHQTHDQLLHDGQNLLLLDKGHLHVDLRELGLPVRPQVLVAEAPGDLEVPLEAGDHEDLLEQLRGLRQRVIASRMQTGGHEVVARPLWGGLRQHRRLDLEEASLVEDTPGLEGKAVTQFHRALHGRPAEIDVAPAQARLLARRGRFIHRERRGLALVQQLQPLDHQLDLPGREVRIDVARSSQRHRPRHRDDVFVSQLHGRAMRLG